MNSREIIVTLLRKVMDRKAYSNILLKNVLNEENVPEIDKKFITQIFYGTLRYLMKIDKKIEYMTKRELDKINVYVLNILRISIYQIDYLDKVPEYSIVNEAVNLAKVKSLDSSKFVNGVLRNYLREKETIKFEFKNEIEEFSYEYSFSEYLVKTLVNQYGSYTTKNILEKLNSTPKVTVRVNNLKTNMEEVKAKLKENEVDFEEGSIKNSLILNRAGSIESNILFKEAKITVQDQSAMLVCEVLSPKENEKVLDMCSAPGGKSIYMAEIMNNKGKITSCDIHSFKLDLISENSKKYGCEIIETQLSDGQVFREDFEGKFDKVLLDAPCSGFGIIAKKPEIKYFKNRDDVKEIISIQKKILNNAKKYVKVGGEIVYSTCTINIFENENLIRDFLKNNENFEVLHVDEYDNDNFLYSEEGFLTILPTEDMDGFFIAKLRRIK